MGTPHTIPAETVHRWSALIESLLGTIEDDFRASGDDDEPTMDLTIGYDPDDGTWDYQTGDNSYSGAAYLYPHWAVLTLTRDSDPDEGAGDAREQIEDLLADVEV
jgi:hypothetical protein